MTRARVAEFGDAAQAPPAATLGAACADVTASLGAAASLGATVSDPRREARLLVAAAAGLAPEAVFGYPDHPITEDARDALDRLVARRLGGEPVSRLLGRREFWSREFRVTPEVLDPRPDSECLIDAALAEIANRAAPLSVLDLGTGSGCLLLALLGELPNACGLGVDISPGALATAKGNADRLELTARAAFRRGDWGKGLGNLFDVILCNPPYIPNAEIDGLAPEVARFDPRRALAGGTDGLDCYRAVAPDLARLIAPGGFAVVELAAGRGDAVAGIFAAAGIAERGRRRDLGGRERALTVVPSTARDAGARKKKVGKRDHPD
ncbi:MAG: peptide chain release factor N(5)-glutamine methyltransferase [Alphaproteobacteria bacterium]